jgi:hypothetical protein
MKTENYFESLTSELNALKNRVRNFIEDAHWLTDGEWKESVLRSVLRRCLPQNVEVGRGFVIGPTYTSKQIDVLLYSTEKPILFKDGDLVFITHDALIGMIEVKTSVNNNTFKNAVNKIVTDLSQLLTSSKSTKRTKILGIFAYENKGVTSKSALRALQEAADNSTQRVVDLCCLGSDFFIKWWNSDPTGKRLANRWHSYQLKSIAPAYFIHNIIEFINPESVKQNVGVWFPLDGKESYKEMELSLKGKETKIVEPREL